MATELLAALIGVNLIAGAAILVVLALRRIAQRLGGPRLAYALWAAVPLAIIASLLPPLETRAPASAPLPGPQIAEALSGGLASVLPASAPAGPAALLVALWLAGAVLVFIWTCWRHDRFMISLGRLRRRADGLSQADGGSFGPAVIGVLFPKIVIPSDFERRFSDGERAMILTHEMVHLRGLDPQVNGLLVLLQCLGWFNPLIHMAARTVRIDQELACDAAVIAFQPKSRRAYAEALLKTQLQSRTLPLGCGWSPDGAEPMRERFAMLKRSAPGAARRTLGGVLVAVLWTGLAYAAWAAQPIGGPAAQAMDAPPLLPKSPIVAAARADQLAPAPADATEVAAEPVEGGPFTVAGFITALDLRGAQPFIYLASADGISWRFDGGGAPTVRRPTGLQAGAKVIVRGAPGYLSDCVALECRGPLEDVAFTLVE